MEIAHLVDEMLRKTHIPRGHFRDGVWGWRQDVQYTVKSYLPPSPAANITSILLVIGILTLNPKP